MSDIPKIGCVNHDCDRCKAADELRRLEAEVQALHKSLADSVLHAEAGLARYESANRMRNELLEDSELHAMARANAGY